MPTITFSTPAELRAYVNANIVPTNGTNKITGEEHNNVENGIIDFLGFRNVNIRDATVPVLTDINTIQHNNAGDVWIVDKNGVSFLLMHQCPCGEANMFPKFIFSRIGADTSTALGVQAAYIGGSNSNVSVIEADMGVGAFAGSVKVEIAYVNAGTFLVENIFCDTTNSNTFWNDIVGWLWMNNFFDAENTGLEYAPLTLYKINDPLNNTFIHIRKVLPV